MSNKIAIEILKYGLKRMNNGKNWCKGNYTDDAGSYCAIGSMMGHTKWHENEFYIRCSLKDFVQKEPGCRNIGGVAIFNARKTTKSEDVKRVFTKTIKYLGG